MFAQDLADGTLRSLKRVGEYRPPAPRSRSTREAVLAAVHSFLTYWRLEGRGPQELRLFRNGGAGKRSAYSFLAHLNGHRSHIERRLKVRGPKAKPPKIVNFETDFIRHIQAANSARDRLLLSAMFDGGLRISQCLGIFHEDLDIARGRRPAQRHHEQRDLPGPRRQAALIRRQFAGASSSGGAASPPGALAPPDESSAPADVSVPPDPPLSLDAPGAPVASPPPEASSPEASSSPDPSVSGPRRQCPARND